MSKKKRPVGRPVSVWTKEYIKEIRDKMNEYIDNEEIPIVAEFAYKNDVHREQLYNLGHWNKELKKMIQKKEANLEKHALLNKVNTTMAVFSLKQLGWSDKQQIEQTVTETESKELATQIKNKIDELDKGDLEEPEQVVDPASKEDV